MTLTGEIGIFLSAMARGIRVPPSSSVATVRTGFTDCIAVMIAGWDEPAVRVVREVVGASASWQSALLLDANRAALVLAAAAHVLDYDDTGLNGHPSAVLVPAVLAAARRTGANGAAMAAAYVAGYEVWAALIARDADLHHNKGWHPSAVFGVLASTAVACVLQQLDAERAAHAMGIAASLAGGLTANFGSMTKSFQLGRAVSSGLEAAQFAQAGLMSAPDVFEHECGFLRAFSPNGRVDTSAGLQLGEVWRILRSGVNVKLWPMCYAAHRIIAATQTLWQRQPVIPSDIVAAEIELGVAQARMLREHAPVTPLEAKFSAEFALASVIVSGQCGSAELTPAFVARSDVRALFEKVRLLPQDGMNEYEPTLSPADRVKLVLRNGELLDSGPVSLPPGHFRRPPSPIELRRKFDDCVARRMSESASTALFDACQRIEGLTGVEALLVEAFEQRRVVA